MRATTPADARVGAHEPISQRLEPCTASRRRQPQQLRFDVIHFFAPRRLNFFECVPAISSARARLRRSPRRLRPASRDDGRALHDAQLLGAA